MPDTTLVRLWLGSVGPVTVEDGWLVRLPADVAAELVRAGDAVRVGDATLSLCSSTRYGAGRSRGTGD